MILAIDVGKGTEDVMIFDEDQKIENSIQLVSPSQAQLIYQRLAADPSSSIVISGELMAGEPYHKLIYQRCAEQPGSVIMTETAARSLRYNLDQVRQKQVRIVPDTEISSYDGSRYVLSDVGWNRIKEVMHHSNIRDHDIDKILLACQDHGEPEDPNRSTRDYRMQTIYKNLDRRGRIEDLMFSLPQIPPSLPRHNAIAASAVRQFDHLQGQDIYVMDSSPAVVLGAKSRDNEIVINMGNGHTLAILFLEDRAQAVYETHTGGVDPDTFEEDILDLLQGNLDHKEALARGAHGVYLNPDFSPLADAAIRELKPYTLIGPNRHKMQDSLAVHLAHPGGSMMMAGPLGLLAAFRTLD